MTKTDEKPYPLGPNIPPAHIKEYPPPFLDDCTEYKFDPNIILACFQKDLDTADPFIRALQNLSWSKKTTGPRFPDDVSAKFKIVNKGYQINGFPSSPLSWRGAARVNK